MSDTGQTRWVLKFISGKYQGGEFPLDEGKEYIIGRSSESHMVLVEDMVSRHHAKLSVIDDKVHLDDMGSTNGSFVNGERVAECILQEGDRILFGTSIIKLIRTDEDELDDLSDMLDIPLEDDLDDASSAPAPTSSPTQAIQVGSYPSYTSASSKTVAGAMSGLLEEVSLPDLLQLFSASRKSGVLRLQNEQEALLYLRDGQVVFAEILGLPEVAAEKAAFRVMTWTYGTFVLEPPMERAFPEEIPMSTEAMMMEAIRLFDELENVRHKLPPMDAVLAVQRPLNKPLRDLSPEQLDTLQLVMNYGAVDSVLNKAPASDLDTMQALEFLVSAGYLEVLDR